MTVSLAQNAIAFLIDLAERGEIDPWDVKVIEVIDRFLQSLKTEPERVPAPGRSPYEVSLSESGKAFLYASMLVLLKADTLIRAEMAEAEAVPEMEVWSDAVEADGPLPLPRHLERHLHRRAIAPPPERRQVTLKELIEQLETIAAAVSEQPPRVRARRARPVPKRQAVRAITQLAHQENLSEIAGALEAFLDQHWETLQPELTWLNFEDLLSEWPQHRPPEMAHSSATAEAADKHERVGVFWGLLYLSAQSKVELSQQTFYKDLWVRHLKGVTDEDDPELPAHVLPD